MPLFISALPVGRGLLKVLAVAVGELLDLAHDQVVISDELCFAHHSQLVAEPVAAGSQLIELEPEVVVPVALRDQVLLGLLYLRPQLVKESVESTQEQERSVVVDLERRVEQRNAHTLNAGEQLDFIRFQIQMARNGV
ncbi:hypothetical protein P4124_16255 [Pseudomonas aeruginosa]|nr:hypothetical protein [Pseudomonas aeruginosa]